ncbi:MAG: hypothetical protein KBS95_04410 [Alistipes sp.]|nr:hypothetical protein [Candidatus Alistipes equi]
MKKIIITLLCCIVALISCQKNDADSSIVGEWSYIVDHIKDDVCYGFYSDHYVLNKNSTFEYTTGYTKLKSLPIGSGMQYATQKQTYLGTYEFRNGILTLCCEYYLDNDTGQLDLSAKTFTYKILTSPITRTTTSIEVYNNQDQQTEIWERN